MQNYLKLLPTDRGEAVYSEVFPGRLNLQLGGSLPALKFSFGGFAPKGFLGLQPSSR